MEIGFQMRRSRGILSTATHLLLLLASLEAVSSQTNSTKPCPQNADINGYLTIADLQNDMDAELSLISSGQKQPNPPYTFVLCPGETYDMTQAPLKPVLSGSIITCGINTTQIPAVPCTFQGGTTQVEIDASTVQEYVLSMIDLIGITFSGFTESAVSGNADGATTVTIQYPTFADFNTNAAVINQTSNTPLKPFIVDVSNAAVRNGVATTIFLNTGGELHVTDAVVFESDVGTVVSTGGTSTNAGTTFLDGIDVSASTGTALFSVGDASFMAANTVSVSQMKNMDAVFVAIGGETQMQLSDITIDGNDLSTVQPRKVWDVVDVSNGANANVTNLNVTNSRDIRHVFSASNSSRLTVDGADLNGIEGGLAVNQTAVSALVFGQEAANVNVNRLNGQSIQYYTAAYFATGQTNMNIARSCLSDGTNNLAAAFVSNTSSLTSDQNYILNYPSTSDACPNETMRLVKEQSGCFNPPEPCTFECAPFFDATTCQANNVLAPTVAPGPTMAPSLMVNAGPTFLPAPAGTSSPANAVSDIPSTVPSSLGSIVPSVLSSGSVSTVPPSMTSSGSGSTISPSVGATGTASGVPTTLESGVTAAPFVGTLAPTAPGSPQPTTKNRGLPTAVPSITMRPTITRTPSRPPSSTSSPAATPTTIPLTPPVSVSPAATVSPAGPSTIVPTVTSTGTPAPSIPATGSPAPSSPATGTPVPSKPSTGSPVPSTQSPGTPAPSNPSTGTPAPSNPSTGTSQPSTMVVPTEPPSVSPAAPPTSSPSEAVSTIEPTGAPSNFPSESPTLEPTALPTRCFCVPTSSGKGKGAGKSSSKGKGKGKGKTGGKKSKTGKKGSKSGKKGKGKGKGKGKRSRYLHFYSNDEDKYEQECYCTTVSDDSRESKGKGKGRTHLTGNGLRHGVWKGAPYRHNKNAPSYFGGGSHDDGSELWSGSSGKISKAGKKSKSRR